MNKKGFTLVELLAVIIVLAILGAITVTAYTKVKEKASDDTFKSLVKEIDDLGPQIYSHEMLMKKDFYNTYKDISNEEFLIITTDNLCKTGYLDKCNADNKLISPFNSSSTCAGYIEVKKTADGPEFGAELYCDTNHKTDGYSSKNLTKGVEITSIN